MAKLFALLVGINEYAQGSGVRNLRGCHNDVDAMKTFLQESYPGLLGENPESSDQIKTLLSAEATRENLIKTFSDHLSGQAKKGDVALFYYSGHGSYENTSKEFERFDGRNKNETIVCHDSRLPGKYDLADKELAYLIDQIDGGVQKVIILDSCHSGSATRSVADSESMGLTRQHPGRTDSGYKRPIESYLLSKDNFYAKQAKNGGQVTIPVSEHILLSSCDRDETALETNDQRGLFSSHLLKVLEAKKTLVSYNQLYLDVRRSVLNDRANQNPTMDALMGFNGNLRFLSDETIDSASYPVRWDENDTAWVLEQGAVHGLPTDPTEIASIGLSLREDQVEEGEPIPARISHIKIDKSYIEAEGLDKGKKYLATINSLPKQIAMRVWLNGNEEQQKAFLEEYKAVASPYIEIDTESRNGCPYEVRLEDDQMRVIHTSSGNFIRGVNFRKASGGSLDIEACTKGISEILVQVEKWERLRNLEKEPTELSREDVKVRLQQVVIKKDKETKVQSLERVIETFPTNEMRFGLELEDKRRIKGIEREIWSKVGIRIVLENNSDAELYFHLFYFNSKYKVRHLEVVQIPANTSEEHELYMGNLNISYKTPEVIEEIDVFKVIASTEKLTPPQFTQDGFPALGQFVPTTRGLEDEDEDDFEAAQIEDWFTTTFTITLAKNLTQISAENSKEVNGLQFGGNEKLKAKVTFAAINTHTRSAEPIYQLPDLLEGSDLEIVDFSNERSDMDKSIIELSDISGEEDLRENPLEINFNQNMIGDDAVYPVAYDGEFIVPIGVMKEAGKVEINHFPESSRERSVVKALKFVFLKSVSKGKLDVFKLRWVDYSSSEKDKRTDEGVAKKVQEAKKILCLLHGIIGNTKQMGEAAEFAVQEKGFDLVLTFDYENLDTPINEIGQKLHEDLEAVGLGANHQKELYLVAHSMGGLVSRYMIENVRKDDGSVKQLIMFGTPNGGSLFGDIPGKIDEKIPDALKELVREKAQEWFNTALGVALNFLPGYVKTVLDGSKRLMKHFNLTPDKPNILETLIMMSPDSEFITQLKSQSAPTNTAYHIVAGSIEHYVTSKEKGWFGRFVEKIELGVGKALYGDQAQNDIAVGTKEILEVRDIATENTSTVVCHHLNYFENEESMAKWKEYL